MTTPTQMKTPLSTALSAAALELRDLHYTYPDGTAALCGINLAIAPGEKVALVGPNGAGKSTLLLHLNGVLRPSRGMVAVGGMVVAERTLAGIRARVGMVFQDPDDQLFSPTVFDDVAFGPIHMGFDAAEVARRVAAALEQVDMRGFERRMPHHMSVGQRKRVAIATVLSMQPEILALDEPSAGLDPRARRGLVGLLQQLPQAMIVSTHDMRLVRDVFPRMVVLAQGRIAADGRSADLLTDTALLEEYGLEAP
ncbi:MAG TPA: ABC transporter ATP-binding protein [Roseiflexaceae bacterium]|nr:ABC transporter ATP-binding protein [Roseiflexaceae bacterium]HMP42230.1 ABC transporter ATP-binding protein [Roseiflexaceae bacterium]